jgi:hypothetical protein
MKTLIAVVFAAASCSFGLFSDRLIEAANAEGAETQVFYSTYYRFHIVNKTNVSLPYKWRGNNYRIEPGQKNYHESSATFGNDGSATTAPKPALRFDSSFEDGYQARDYKPGELSTSKTLAPVYTFLRNGNNIDLWASVSTLSKQTLGRSFAFFKVSRIIAGGFPFEPMEWHQNWANQHQSSEIKVALLDEMQRGRNIILSNPTPQSCKAYARFKNGAISLLHATEESNEWHENWCRERLNAGMWKDVVNAINNEYAIPVQNAFQ